MAAHAAVPARHHGSLSWALPVTLGVAYGIYVVAIDRGAKGFTSGQFVLGVVSGLVLAALAFALGRIQQALPRELRSAAYAALCGVAIGFLYSLTGESVLKSAGMGVIFAAVMFAASFYVFYTREP
ncbi:hypothetical protein HRW18_21215 [Streptomyces lunaelactis]|uniref:hypothetical protein n=1 Tax=Streptomyces lunaelactis TaxID=1535768 RepID=UPI00158587B0|nr:hypothetical protein [Streptomyces lunaelactis]NUK10457.1 hypothetical protein [Streptomyces lunaelactis]NUK38780.1 hypothetical protein [Streptomyces lunaelactis]NUK45828.1 hypothetical protein [Streptomyces lunaelactis]NUK59008.1 hypothetical protein [Streptomyces lunaelactis]NUK93302.1 hypothetical protein [Streptomyces lunaelactis]